MQVTLKLEIGNFLTFRCNRLVRLHQLGHRLINSHAITPFSAEIEPGWHLTHAIPIAFKSIAFCSSHDGSECGDRTDLAGVEMRGTGSHDVVLTDWGWRNCSVMCRVRYHPLREEAQRKLSGQLDLEWEVSSL